MRFLPLALAALSFSSFAETQVDSRINMPVSHPEIAIEEGWKFAAKVGVITNWDFNQFLPGIDDGHYLRLGGSLAFTTAYLNGCLEWRNKLLFAETFTKVPFLSEFLKSNDRLSVESLVMWSFGRWWGGYGRLNFDTSALPGENVQTGSVTYRIFDLTGASTTQTADRLHLTDAFKPLYFKESLGLFARPINLSSITVELKAGAYALQALVNGQRKLGGTNPAGEVQIMPLGDFYHIGPTLGAFFFGDIIPDAFFYQLNGDVGYAAFQSSEVAVGGDFARHLNFTGYAQVTFKAFDWMELSYGLRLVYLPEITTGLEIDNKFYLNFPFSI